MYDPKANLLPCVWSTSMVGRLRRLGGRRWWSTSSSLESSHLGFYKKILSSPIVKNWHHEASKGAPETWKIHKNDSKNGIFRNIDITRKIHITEINPYVNFPALIGSDCVVGQGLRHIPEWSVGLCGAWYRWTSACMWRRTQKFIFVHAVVSSRRTVHPGNKLDKKNMYFR